MRDYFESVAGLLNAILFVLSVGFVFLGIRLVYLGTAQSPTIELFDLTLPTGILGKTSIAIGALGLMLLVRSVIRAIRDMFSMPHRRTGR
jgi:hypothetical protein